MSAMRIMRQIPLWNPSRLGRRGRFSIAGGILLETVFAMGIASACFSGLFDMHWDSLSLLRPTEERISATPRVLEAAKPRVDLARERLPGHTAAARRKSSHMERGAGAALTTGTAGSANQIVSGASLSLYGAQTAPLLSGTLV